MTISPAQLNRATLARQMLLGREAIAAADAVRRMVAIQSQEPASTYIALWNRVERFNPAELDAAFVSQKVLRASLMRIAIQVVHAADHPHFHRAMQPSLRAARLNDRRFAAAGISIEDADSLLPEVVDFLAKPRSTPDVERWLDDRLGTPPSRARIWWAMRHYGPFVHAATTDPWSFGARNRYRAAPRGSVPADSPAALAHLIRRYLEGFGPATIQDIRQFTMAYMPPIRAAVELLGDALVSLPGPDGAALLDVRGSVIPSADTPAPPRLLGMWDNTLLAHANRERVIPPQHRRRVIQSNGDVLPTVLVDGFVAGIWRHVDDAIEVSAFQPLAEETWAGLTMEGRSLLALLAPRDRQVYGRYGRWWERLPAPAEVRRIRR